MTLRVLFACFTLVAGSALASDFSNCQELFARSPVRASSEQVEVCHKSGQYAVLYSPRYKAASYCAELLSTASIDRAAMDPRSGDNAQFHESTQLAKGMGASLQDFRGSGYDRGHLCPYADLGPATNDLLQIQMQAPQMNRKPWAKVESDTRRYVRRTMHAVYVISGATHHPNEKRVKGVGVPSHFYKLVIDPQTNKSWAYIMPNQDDAVLTKPVSEKELYRFLGYRLLEDPKAPPKESPKEPLKADGTIAFSKAL